MTDGQKKAYAELGKKFILPFSENFIDFSSVFANGNPLILEIGFGMGDATYKIAENNPEINYIGAEVYPPGVGSLLLKIREHNINNIRIINNDAFDIVRKMFQNESLAGAHIFFPDPWPKTRHHKRRLINEKFIAELSTKIKKDGYIYIATDWKEYAENILDILTSFSELKNKYSGLASPQDWRPSTRFEAKGIKQNREIYEIFFIKIQ